MDSTSSSRRHIHRWLGAHFERHGNARRFMAAGICFLILISAAGFIFISKGRDHIALQTKSPSSQHEKGSGTVPQRPSHPQSANSGGNTGNDAARPTAGKSPPPPNAFTVNCADCHGSHGQGGDIGPKLTGITSKPRRSPKDLEKLLEDPRAFGLHAPMPESFPDLPREDKRQIVEWLSKL